MEPELTTYYNFIEKCRNKEYKGDTHRHHIIPKFMGGTDDEDNIIALGYKDHQQAHLKLAECFPQGDERNWKNVCSAAVLQHWVNNPDLKGKMSEALKGVPKSEEHKKALRGPRPHVRGKNNHFYGKGHFGEDNPMYGRSVLSVWIEKYGEKTAMKMEKEYRKKVGKSISMATKGVPKSEEHKKALKEAKKKFWENASEEYRKAWGERIKGQPSYERDEDHKQLMSQAVKEALKKKPRERITCIHCGKTGVRSNINRWHNDNCKHKQV